MRTMLPRDESRGAQHHAQLDQTFASRVPGGLRRRVRAAALAGAVLCAVIGVGSGLSRVQAADVGGFANTSHSTLAEHSAPSSECGSYAWPCIPIR